jgi:hypothetical protein
MLLFIVRSTKVTNNNNKQTQPQKSQMKNNIANNNINNKILFDNEIENESS